MLELIAAFILALGLALASEPATLTWYGSESDGLLGARHGASWHGDPCGLPNEVDLESFGCAAPRWIPYCSRLLVCVGERCVTVTVVDRQALDVLDGRWHVDLWPAAAEALGMVEAGIVEGWVWEMKSDSMD